MLARVRAAFEIRPGEGAAALWAGLAFCLLLSSYYLLRPVRDTFAIDGDPNFLPWLFTATFAAMLALAGPWGALVARVPRRRLVPLAYRALIVQLAAFAALIAGDVAPGVVGKVFYVWLSAFNLFVVSVFWSVCADLARPEQGERLFGPIAAGGTVGALLGPLVTRTLAARVEPWFLLLLAAALLEGAVWAMAMVERTNRTLTPRTAPAPAIGGGPLEGLVHVARSPYLAGIATYALCAATLATFVYLEQAGIAREALPDRAARTRFFADVDLWTNLGALALQLFAVSRLLRRLGPGVVLACLPVVQAIGLTGLELAPSLGLAIAVSAVGRATTHALSRPARELLFTAVSREDRYKSKNVIDTLGYRLGDFSAAWLHRGLAALGVALAGVGVPVAAAWLVLALALGREHRRRTATAPDAAPEVTPAPPLAPAAVPSTAP